MNPAEQILTEKNPPVKLTALNLRNFWRNVNKTATCWMWVGVADKRGRGYLRINGPKMNTSRVSWLIHNGQIPEGMCVCHTCDVPGCVNPSHLWLGTHFENMRDRENKGRNKPLTAENHDLRIPPEKRARGENVGLHKLTEGEVKEIRNLSAQRDLAAHVIGAMFGVTASTVQRVINRKTWKHVS